MPYYKRPKEEIFAWNKEKEVHTTFKQELLLRGIFWHHSEV